MNGLVHSLKKRIPGKITMDNIDGMLMANHIRLGSGNKHYHYAASTYYVDRCDVSHLSMVQPQLPDVLSPDVLFLNNEEELDLKRNYGYQVMGVVMRCRQTSNIRCILVCNKIVDHSDVGTAPITSSFSTRHLALIYCTKTTAWWGRFTFSDLVRLILEILW